MSRGIKGSQSWPLCPSMSGPDLLSEGSRCEGVGQDSLPAPVPFHPPTPRPRHLLPLGDMLGQAAGILCILIMAWPASCHCHLLLTLPACSPGKKHPTQGARCLSPIAGMTSLPASSFLHGFAIWYLWPSWASVQLSSPRPPPQPLGIPLSPGLWVFLLFSRPLTSTCLSQD